MHALDQVTDQGVPETMMTFVRMNCLVSQDVIQWLPAHRLPKRDHQLLVHSNDMTSTLSNFHGSALHVDILQIRNFNGLYLREVFLRTESDAIVEYGVLAVALDQFTVAQQSAIQAGEIPLGGLLHQFKMPFVSSPIGYVSIPAKGLSHAPLPLPMGTTCFGRFNRLSKPTGEPLAWILEILPLA